MSKYEFLPMPDEHGYFGEYGGQENIPPELKLVMDDIYRAYCEIRDSQGFQSELQNLFQHYVGRPSPIYFAKRLSEQLGGAEIYLKREDLNHTGAHKINHCIGEALLAKHMGKTKVLAETGAGQHGVALATACALLDLPCEIHMGEVDVQKEHPNVTRMKILGAKVISVTRGTRTLKDAVDSAFEAYLEDPQNYFYAIGSVVGPHPFPQMVRDFQRVVGDEAREQFQQMTGQLPNQIVACVGGGSNAMGIFTAFLEDDDVKITGVEPSGLGLNTPDHAATLSKGRPGSLHGYRSYVLMDEQGKTLPVYSIASGLDYPSVGPQHSYLHDIKRVEYVAADDQECLDAFMKLSQVEGIIPALESAHALAHAIKIAPQFGPEYKILVNLSGRGDKDVDFVADKLGL
ncbi:MAG: tryptophan synthase subunit beta [Pseudomonadales bacterium]|nr:tryptophan synthase subunit beta [Pseudomonadales bacterium]MCP5216041.1 tryptophan synthase subunit beta [Pseudomonadales bacterium]